MNDGVDRTFLLATDADEVFAEVDAALADSATTVARVRAGRDVLAAVRELSPHLVMLDLQIGNMGGVATALALRNEEGAGRLDPVPVIMLLDRSADVFLARRARAEGWLIKPIDPLRLMRATNAVLDGRSHTEGLAG